jgi:diguanylate cyclase (GGDEF)-like protein/PAS domain S-box-containing protein
MVDDAEPDVPRGAGELPDEAFRMIVDLTANPFVVLDRAGVVRYAGGSIESTLGWRPGELVGRSMADFLPPDQIALALEALAEIEEVDRGGAGVPMVFAVLQPDGTTAWVEIGAMPLLDVPGVDGIVLRHRPWGSQHHFDQFVTRLLADEPLDDVLPALARSIAESVGAAGAAVHHGFDGDRFAAAAGAGVPGACLVAAEGPWCETARTGLPGACSVASLPAPARDAAVAVGLDSCWTVAVPRSAELAPAVLSVWRAAEGPPLIGHRHVLERASRYVQLALVRTAEHERLRHLAGHDALTGVANRVQFRDRLARALAIGERDLAVAFCDLDGFKAVNDTFGHRAGDSVLVEAAERLRGVLRLGDDLARMGGDEFTVLLRNVPDATTAGHVAERLLEAVLLPYVVEGVEVGLGLSIGVALAERGVTADALLARADEALYLVKRRGGGGAHIETAGGT